MWAVFQKGQWWPAGWWPLGLCEESLHQWSNNLSFLLLQTLTTCWTQVSLQLRKKYLLESSQSYISETWNKIVYQYDLELFFVISPKGPLGILNLALTRRALPALIHCSLVPGLCKLAFVKCLQGCGWGNWCEPQVLLIFSLQRALHSVIDFWSGSSSFAFFSCFLSPLFTAAYLECH